MDDGKKICVAIYRESDGRIDYEAIGTLDSRAVESDDNRLYMSEEFLRKKELILNKTPTVISVADCIELHRKFSLYCDAAEQHEFPLLAILYAKLDSSVSAFRQSGIIANQKEARAMFRVILRIMGEDYSEYEEPASND